MTNRRAIPEEIKRKVRKRCRFGCVICGNPIVEYEHIKEYHKERAHEEKNITLLCPNHHSMVTKGLISKDVVIQSNKNPFNNDKSKSKSISLIFNNDIARLYMGDNVFIQEPFQNEDIFTCLEINQKKIIYFKKEEGVLLFSCFIFDKIGNAIFAMLNNELVFSLKKWDVTLIGKSLIIREASRDIILDISFGEDVRINKMNLLFDKRNIIIKNNNLIIGGNVFSGLKVTNCEIAVSI